MLNYYKKNVSLIFLVLNMTWLSLNIYFHISKALFDCLIFIKYIFNLFNVIVIQLVIVVLKIILMK